MKNKIRFLFALLIPVLVAATPGSSLVQAGTTIDEFNTAGAKNNLIADGLFTDINSMTSAQVQSFLERKGSYLKDFSEGGRSAAQIIYDAAHGYGDASGSIYGVSVNTTTGTVSPSVLLVVLQKEQSLITKTTRDDRAITKAMGYACPDNGSSNDANDNGCNDAYEGFSKQVENAAWQLRYNFEISKNGVSWWNQYYSGQEHYYVGLTKTFSDGSYGTQTATPANSATASLYRYTPHVFYGNYNFWKLYVDYFETPEYHSSYVDQSVWVGGAPGNTFNMYATFKNTGTSTWQKSGSSPVVLAVHYRKDMEEFNKRFRSSSWVSADRIAWLPNNVASGETVTIPFSITIPSDLAKGEYQFYVQLVAENYTWLNENGGGAWWTVKVGDFQSAYIDQSMWVQGAPGSTHNMSVTLKNNGTGTWQRSATHPVVLAVHYRKDMEEFNKSFRNSSWVSTDRIAWLPNDVLSGDTVTVPFSITIPSGLAPGDYQFYVQLVVEGYSWLPEHGGGAWWTVRVN
ncbi:MAG: hypothetical protein WCT32_02535 [Patescibacteria group bacterium]|jgi:hypothetical protein